MRIRPAVAIGVLLPALFAAPPSRFTIEQVLSAPFPTSLTAAPAGGAVAWVLDQRGSRNIWVAEAPDYRGRRLTPYDKDDGQEIDELAWTPDGRAIVYVRGGDFETEGAPPNPADLTAGVEQTIWIAPLAGDAPHKLAEGHEPAVSPDGKQVAFLKNHEIWSVDIGGDAKPAQLLHARGTESDLRWSPDGKRLAFASRRTDHGFIGVYDVAAKSLHYLDPSVDTDAAPIWSPDSQRIAFIRIPASSIAFAFGPVRTAQPWSIRVANATTGDGREIWKAAEGTGSAHRSIDGHDQLFWAAGDRIVFEWERTGWLHLYSVPAGGGTPVQLTSGEFEVENASITPDRAEMLISSNQGDIDRRHIWRVPVAGGPPHALTSGAGIEWTPVSTSDGNAFAFLRSDARIPGHAAIISNAGAAHDLAPDSIPPDFPAAQLVVPQQVIFNSADGMSIHGQLFLPPDYHSGERHPAAIFLHGGSRRQMLLGWHYMDYYSNAYGMNQYLASQGWVVLAINYRSGIGYGLNFREALNYGATGASEFNDVLGAGVFLRGRADVDPARIALWGGSYGGYLTALGLARASDLFAAGVDFHGVHDWNLEIPNFVKAYDPLKDTNVARLAYESSPMSSVSTWRSPVLLIHGDDDRNVPFDETVRLVEALRKQHLDFEELIFPDEIHGFLMHASWLKAYTATARFLNARLGSSR
jgi:dipeptidyl aminopeptidase/acylaminoacyl peptidase